MYANPLEILPDLYLGPSEKGSVCHEDTFPETEITNTVHTEKCVQICCFWRIDRHVLFINKWVWEN